MRRSSRRARVNSRLGLWPVNRPVLPLAPLQRGGAEPRLEPRTTGRRLPSFTRIAVLVLACVALPLAMRPASAQAIGQGFELERAGHHQQAVTVYFATVRADPTNVPALLGLERVLPLLGRLPELLPVVQHAVAASPPNGLLGALLLRTYVALNE